QVVDDIPVEVESASNGDLVNVRGPRIRVLNPLAHLGDAGVFEPLGLAGDFLSARGDSFKQGADVEHIPNVTLPVPLPQDRRQVHLTVLTHLRNDHGSRAASRLQRLSHVTVASKGLGDGSPPGHGSGVLGAKGVPHACTSSTSRRKSSPCMTAYAFPNP